jgi:hypothetical protein
MEWEQGAQRRARTPGRALSNGFWSRYRGVGGLCENRDRVAAKKGPRQRPSPRALPGFLINGRRRYRFPV